MRLKRWVLSVSDGAHLGRLKFPVYVDFLSGLWRNRDGSEDGDSTDGFCQSLMELSWVLLIFFPFLGAVEKKMEV